MAIETKFVWKGPEFLKLIDKAYRKTLLEASFLIRGKAVSLVPVDTGLLRNSITFAISGSAEDFPNAVKDGEEFTLQPGVTIRAGKNEAIIGTVVFYGGYVEFGTRSQKAQAYMLPAYLDSRNTVINFAKKNIQAIRFIN